MGNLTIGNFRSDAPASDEAPRGKCVTRRISSSVTYYYSPLSEAGRPPKSAETLARSPCAPSVTDSSSTTDVSSSLLSDSILSSGDQSHAASTSRPLLVFFSWFGAKPGPVAKYRDIYLDRGMDVLLVQSSMMHFLWPSWGRDYGLTVLSILEEPRFCKRMMLVHAASIGGYTFTHILAHFANGEKKHRGVAERVIGHIYDSLVVGSLEYMAIGIGTTLLPRLRSLVKNIAMLYFWLFKRHTADIYEALVQVFRHGPITAPALFFYSEDDALCDTAAIENVIDLWRNQGIVVHTRKWKESIHAAHMRCHPEDYFSTLQRFLDSLQLSCLEAES